MRDSEGDDDGRRKSMSMDVRWMDVVVARVSEFGLPAKIQISPRTHSSRQNPVESIAKHMPNSSARDTTESADLYCADTRPDTCMTRIQQF
jgi:hypothetical protein